MDIAIGELTPQQQAEWEIYLNSLNKEEEEITKRKKNGYTFIPIDK